MSAAARPALNVVPSTPLDSISGLADRLRRTFGSGKTRPLEWRRSQLKALKALVRERGDELVEALQADLRKPTLEAWAADVGQVTTEAAMALRKLRSWTKPQRTGFFPLGRSRIVHEPLGVVLIIAPWNYPVGLLLTPLVGAVAAGNCAVLKPSEVTMRTSAVLGRRIPEYLDPEAIAIVEGGVDETQALLDQRFDHIFYTGNGRVGRVVMEAAAKHLTPVTLELGGKSPCIVDHDVDLKVAARRIAWGKFMNAGQTCIAPDYILVHEGREQELVRELGAAIHDFFGDDPKRTPDYARVVNRRHHERLTKLLESGEAAIGGQSDPEDCYIAPTVLRGVAKDSPIMQEEIFGPILPILSVRGVDDAIEFVRRGEKPLALYLFSSSEATAEKVVGATSSGGVCVNGTIFHIANPALPFGGVGESGMGAYHGRHTFETFSHKKSVLSRGLRFDPKWMYPPYGGLKTKLVQRFLK
ncbi:MAG TPA: aldehyde dehydrogenase family protein [Myxococcota bacterium]|nr:aldehyde dehydrogenase family protein [Myxococcota bacterium]